MSARTRSAASAARKAARSRDSGSPPPPLASPEWALGLAGTLGPALTVTSLLAHKSRNKCLHRFSCEIFRNVLAHLFRRNILLRFNGRSRCAPIFIIRAGGRAAAPPQRRGLEEGCRAAERPPPRPLPAWVPNQWPSELYRTATASPTCVGSFDGACCWLVVAGVDQVWTS